MTMATQLYVHDSPSTTNNTETFLQDLSAGSHLNIGVLPVAKG